MENAWWSFEDTWKFELKPHYYTSYSLWKVWLVKSIQSIHNSLWTWQDKCNICSRYCIYHGSTSTWLLSPLECSPQKQNGWMLRFCFWRWIMWKMYNKTIIEFVSVLYVLSVICVICCLCYLPQPSASADNTDLGFNDIIHIFMISCSTSSNNCLLARHVLNLSLKGYVLKTSRRRGTPNILSCND